MEIYKLKDYKTVTKVLQKKYKTININNLILHFDYNKFEKHLL
jgi:hypothetical protein